MIDMIGCERPSEPTPEGNGLRSLDRGGPWVGPTPEGSRAEADSLRPPQSNRRLRNQTATPVDAVRRSFTGNAQTFRSPDMAFRKHLHELNGTFLPRRREEAEDSFAVRPALDVEPSSSVDLDRSDLFRSPRATDNSIYQAHAGEQYESATIRQELLLEEGNLLPFHFLRAGDRIGRAVVKLQREDGATGTGFLVAPDILLTNHHVLPDAATAAKAAALANYETNPPADYAGRATVVPLDPGRLFVTNADLDFTFCGVEGLAFLGSVALDREQMHVKAEETVNIIQHPRGRPKEVVLRDNWVVRADSVVLHYSCDTEPGSSGSPVFNNNWKPVALHHASVLTDSPEGRTVAGDDTGRYLNEGIRLSAIALWLETAEANAPDQRDQVSRLRALFGGINARVGFFGALGRWSRGRSAPEVVADSFRGEPDKLDLGYWNTKSVGGVVPERAEEMARVVADMGLDLWCFTDAETDGVKALIGCLSFEHRLDYEAIFLGEDPGPAPLIIYRKIKNLQVDRIPPTQAAGEAPMCFPASVRVKAGRKRGGMVELRLALVRRKGEVAALPSAIGDGSSTTRSDNWLLLGETSTLLAPETLAAIDATGRPWVAASGGPGEGGTAWLPGEASTIDQLFGSPNLRTTFGPSEAIQVALDRTLPESLNRLVGPKPIALRLTLEDGPQSSQIDSPLNPMVDDDDLERRLRQVLEPIVAQLVAELRGERQDRVETFVNGAT